MNKIDKPRPVTRVPALGESARRFVRDHRGQALVMFALMSAGLLAFMGLVLDGGRIYFEKRAMQVAADAAALAGAQELLRRNDGVGGRPDYVDSAAWDDATLNGYNRTKSDIDVDVTHPAPVYGATHVQVVITRRVPTTFMRIVNVGQSMVRARAVAGIELDAGPPCILAMNPTASGALTASGGAILDAPTCNILVNSNANDAVIANGGGNAQGCSVTGYSIGYVAPGNSITNGGGTLCPQPTGRAMPAPDPYEYMDEPDPNAYPVISNALYTVSNGNASSRSPLSPGRYIGGLKITGGTVVFDPGVYVVDGLEVTGGTISGDGVTIYNTGAGLQHVQINGNVQANLTAPTSGYYQNMLFMNSRSIPKNNDTAVQILGTADSVFEGVHYFSTVHLQYGGNQTESAPWAMVIADTIQVAGTPNFGLAFDGTSGRSPNTFRVALVE